MVVVVSGVGLAVGHAVFLPRVHLTILKSGVRGRDPPGEEITKTVISRDYWYLRVGLSLFFVNGRMLRAAASKISNPVILPG